VFFLPGLPTESVHVEEESQVSAVEQSRTMQVPEAVVTQILPPTSGTVYATTVAVSVGL